MGPSATSDSLKAREKLQERNKSGRNNSIKNKGK